MLKFLGICIWLNPKLPKVKTRRVIHKNVSQGRYSKAHVKKQLDPIEVIRASAMQRIACYLQMA